MKNFRHVIISFVFAMGLTSFAFTQNTTSNPDRVRKTPIEVPKEMLDKVDQDGEKYDVPLIDKDNFKEGKVKLSAELEGLTAIASLNLSGDGTTYLKISTEGRTKIAKEKIYFVWLATPEGKYKKIGEVSYSEKEEKSEINGRVPMDNFGIFITSEDSAVEKPTSKVYAAFKQEPGE